MYRDNFYHSSEGSTWTKKNHKYIRKEGNRYIYPEDLQTNRARREGVSKRQTEFEEFHRQRRENRQNTLNRQGSPDYKKLSEQHANRKAAANGKIVNPIATWRGSDGKVLAREKTNEKINAPNTADYKKYGQLRGGRMNRYDNVSKQGSTSGQEYAKKHALDTKRKSALNSQGSSSKNYEYAKEHDDWKNALYNRGAEHYSIRSRRKAAQYTSERPYYTDGGRGRSTATSESAKYESERRNKYGSGTKYQYSAREANRETVNNASNKLKKKGYFTVQNGETKFVPSDDITMKKVSKGEKIVNKLKGLFKKKKKQ